MNEEVCRVCHCESEPNRPLFYPCKCSGSIKYVHQDCLMQWLKVKTTSLNDASCELCGEKLHFRNIYSSSGGPPEITTTEFLMGLVPLFKTSATTVWRIVSFLTMWFVILPLLTNAWSDVCTSSLFERGIRINESIPRNIKDLVSFWWNGALNLIFILFVSIFSFHTFLYMYQEYAKIKARVQAAIESALERQQQHHHQQHQHAEDSVEAMPMPPVPDDGLPQRRLPVEMGEAIITDASVDGGGASERPDNFQSGDEVNITDDSVDDGEIGRLGVRGDEFEMGDVEHAVHAGDPGPGIAAAPGAEAGAEEVAAAGAGVEEDVDREQHEQHEQQRQLEVLAVDGGEGMDLNLNVNDIFLINGIVDFTAERFLFCILYSFVTLFLLNVAPALVGRRMIALYGGLPKEVGDFITDVVSTISDLHEDLSMEWNEILSIMPRASELSDFASLGNSATLRQRLLIFVESAVGYSAAVAFLILGLIGYAAVLWNRRANVAIVLLIEDQFRSLRKSIFRGARLGFSVTLDFVCFPQMIGWVIGIVTLRAFNTTFAQRCDQCTALPLFCFFAHWLCGSFFLLHMSMFVSVLRKFIRKDLLVKSLPDYNAVWVDIGDHTFQTYENLTLKARLEWFVTHGFVLLLAVVFFVAIPSRVGYILSFLSSPPTLRFQQHSSEFQISSEMIVFHVIMPAITERVPLNGLSAVLWTFFHYSCALLRLENLLEASEFPALQEPLHVYDTDVSVADGGEEVGRVMQERDSADDALDDIKDIEALLLEQERLKRKKSVDVYRDPGDEERTAQSAAPTSNLYNLMMYSVAMMQALRGGCRVQMVTDINAIMSAFQEHRQKFFYVVIHLKMKCQGCSELSQDLYIWSALPAAAATGYSATLYGRRDAAAIAADVDPLSEAAGMDISTTAGLPTPQRVLEQRIERMQNQIEDLERLQQRLERHSRRPIAYNNRERERDASDLDARERPAHLPLTFTQWLRSLKLDSALPFWARCMLLGLLGGSAISVVASWALYIPLMVGRRGFKLMRAPHDHDLYNFIYGSLTCAVLINFLNFFLSDCLRIRGDLESVFMLTLKWVWIVMKVVSLGVMWFVVPPVLIGTIVEAVLVNPFWAFADETPRYPFVQCWAIGLILFKVWAKMVFVGAFGDNELRRNFNRIWEQGFVNFDATFVFNKIILRILLYLLDFLIIPFFLARVVSMCLTSYEQQTFVSRAAFPAYVIFVLLKIAVEQTKKYMSRLYEEIRDSRYLLGTELTNR